MLHNLFKENPLSRKDHSAKLILLLYFFLGAFSLVIQTIFIRELFIIEMGNEFVFGIIFSLWLLGIFWGAFTGSRICKKAEKVLPAFFLGIFLIFFISFISIFMVRLMYSLTSTPAGTFISIFKFTIFSFFIIFPFSFNVGFLFPLASRIQYQKSANKTDIPKTTALMSSVYIYESIGALFGGIVYSFFFNEYFNSLTNTALFAFPLLLVVFLFLKSLNNRILLLCSLILIIVNLILLIPSVNSRLNNFTIKKRWEGFSNSLMITQADSKYHNLSLGKSADQFQLFLNGQLSMVFPEKHSSLLTASLLFCQHKSAKSVLVIGDAISGLAEQLLKFKQVKIDSIEMDEYITKITRKFLPPSLKKILLHKNFSLFHLDGRKYIQELNQNSSKKYDLIFINTPQPNTLLANRYYTIEFFRDIKRILLPEGILSLKIPASETYRHGVVNEYTQIIYNTLKKTFPHIVIAPGTEYFFFASRSDENLTEDAEILIKRYKNSDIKEKDFSLMFYSIFEKERIHRLKKNLMTSAQKSINSDEKPLAVFYLNQISGWYSGSNLEGFFAFFKNIRLTGIFFVLLISGLIFYFFYRISSGKKLLSPRISLYIIIFFIGFSCFSLHLLLIYSFQNNFGFVFKLIGFLTALFMFGLPLGAYMANKVLNRKKILQVELKALTVILALLFILSVLLPLILGNLQSINPGEIILFLLIVILGILTGSVYPLAIAFLIREKEGGEAAGIFNALDHLGASFGAFFTGLILLPLMGISLTCHLIAALSLMCLLLVIVSRKRSAS